MKTNTIYIIPKGSFGDKGNNLQFIGSTQDCDEIKSIVRGIGQWGEHPQYKELSLFIQGDSRYDGVNHWVMIEAWSFNDDLFWDFCHFIAEKLNLPIELGFPVKSIVDHGIDYHEL